MFCHGQLGIYHLKFCLISQFSYKQIINNKKTVILNRIVFFIKFLSKSQFNHETALSPGKVNLKSDSGKYLARCNGCGPGAYPDSAAIHVTNPSEPWAIWTIEVVGSQVAFKADTGKYLSRCNNCWSGGGGNPDSAFVHVSSLSGAPWALWTPQQLPNGKWAFKGNNGKYLARCNNCVTGGTTRIMHLFMVDHPMMVSLNGVQLAFDFEAQGCNKINHQQYFQLIFNQQQFWFLFDIDNKNFILWEEKALIQKHKGNQTERRKQGYKKLKETLRNTSLQQIQLSVQQYKYGNQQLLSHKGMQDQKLTTLHQQFQRKHRQLSQITQKIDLFMRNFRAKGEGESKGNICVGVRKIKQAIQYLKEQLKIIKQDLITYSQFPKDYLKMIVELPILYETIWQSREQILRKDLLLKDTELDNLRQIAQQRNFEIIKLKEQLNNKEYIIEKLKNQKQDKSSRVLQLNEIKKYSNNSMVNLDIKIPGESLKNREKPNQIITNFNIDGDDEDDLDSYINNMEITIRENDETLFKKITEQCQQQEDQDSNSQFLKDQEKSRRNLTARVTYGFQLSQTSSQFGKDEKVRKKSQSSILNKSIKQVEDNNKNKFWNKLTKNVKPNEFKSKSKRESQKGKSIFKQNSENRQPGKSLSSIEKTILTSKITDFRKILFNDKGFDRVGFRF